MITSFNISKSANLGGYASFKFIPSKCIEAFPILSNGVALVPVKLLNGNNWLDGYATSETLKFTEEQVITDHGVYFSQTIEGFCPGDDHSIRLLFENLAKQRLIVLIKAGSGKWKLVGSPGSPLKFSAVFSSGEKRTDPKGYTFKFYANSLFSAPDYYL